MEFRSYDLRTNGGKNEAISPRVWWEKRLGCLVLPKRFFFSFASLLPDTHPHPHRAHASLLTTSFLEEDPPLLHSYLSLIFHGPLGLF